jgi:hypothetical protein
MDRAHLPATGECLAVGNLVDLATGSVRDGHEWRVLHA